MSAPDYRAFRVGFLFCGLGAGARGFLEARARLGEDRARFENAGGIDLDAEACADFERLTGSLALRADVATLSPAELRAAWGSTAPDCVFASPPCLPGDGPVLTIEGPRRIADVRAGDLVLTHRGRYRRVRAVGASPYDGTLYGLRLNGTVDVQEFTANHPIWRRRVVRRATATDRARSLAAAEFVPAGSIRAGDRVGFPIAEETPGTARAFVESFGDPRVITRGGRSTGRYAKPRHIATTARVADLRPFAESLALWWLLGVYLGDGYRRASRHEVIFCVGATDSELAIGVREALSTLGRVIHEDQSGGRSNVKLRVTSRHLSMLAGAFGDGAWRKDVPAALASLEAPLLRAMFDGYFAADGSAEGRRTARNELQARRKIASTSLPLLRSMQRLLLRLGEFWSIHQCWPGGAQVVEGRTVKTRPRWELSHRADPKKRTVFEFADGAVWIRVRAISTRVAKLRVWNLDVEEDDTFCAPLIATHNCKGFSGLLSAASAGKPEYQRLNRLVLQGIFLLLEAWPDSPPATIVLENVPRITSRGAGLLHQVRELLTRAGYRLHEGQHECGEVGGLAQRRRRFLLVARHERQVPAFIYRPPVQRVKGCGEVLDELAVPIGPDARSAGPLHVLPRISWLTWVRLALIPPGGDWRDLPGVVPNGSQRRSVWARYDVRGWGDPARTVAGEGSNGGFAIADPRIALPDRAHRHWNKFRVSPWENPAGTVTGSDRVGSGAPSVADPRLKGIALAMTLEKAAAFKGAPGLYGVADWTRATGAVTGSASVSGSNSTAAIADPRIPLNCRPRAGVMGVLGWEHAAQTITGNARVDNGSFAVADPRKLAIDPPPIISPWNCWHRPMTTLELAALQGLPTILDGEPLRLAGRSVGRWRERIGNAVPVGAARAVGDSILSALLAAALGTWTLGSTGIWVRDDGRSEHEWAVEARP